MRKWEDIVKEKMEEPEGILPESVLDEFHSLQEAPADKPKPFPWVWVAVPALAAGLAAVLLLREPSEGIQIVQQPQAPVAVVTETDDETDVPEETVGVDDVVRYADSADTAVSDGVADTSVSADTAVSDSVADTSVSVDSADSTDTGISTDTANRDGEASGEGGENLPPVPDDTSAGTQPAPAKGKTKMGPAAGVVSGGGLLAAVISPAIGSASSSSGHGPFMGGEGDKLLDDPVHYFPIKLGVSAMIPVADRWFVTTGLNYSLYLSSFNYRIAGKQLQAAHYLGVPVKINYVLASNNMFDLYLGAGLEGDKCLGADGFSLSLQGAGGVQMNLGPRFGIYLEPELSWRIPTGTPALETYRSAHPLMFTVAGGLRFRLGRID